MYWCFCGGKNSSGGNVENTQYLSEDLLIPLSEEARSALRAATPELAFAGPAITIPRFCWAKFPRFGAHFWREISTFFFFFSQIFQGLLCRWRGRQVVFWRFKLARLRFPAFWLGRCRVSVAFDGIGCVSFSGRWSELALFFLLYSRQRICRIVSKRYCILFVLRMESSGGQRSLNIITFRAMSHSINEII